MPEPDLSAAASPPALPAPRRVPLEEKVAVLCMAALVLITLLNVVTRYLTDQSFAWTEEISIVLMVVMTLAGTAAAAARDAHVRIEALYDGGSARRRRALRLFSAGATALVFALLTVLFARMVADEIRWAETSMGLGVPRWWFTAAVPLLTAAVALRSLLWGLRVWRQHRAPGDAPST
jgi:TRAP-type C4-dicarboxylate transport system permease small subunit